MTNKRTFKFQLSTLVIIALIAMLSVACKNKATVPTVDLSATEEFKESTVYNSGNGYKAEIGDSKIKIEYKDSFGGQGDLVINKEGKTSIKAKNSKVGFNLIIDGEVFLATDATPNYANGNLSAIVFSGNGQSKTVNFSK